MVPDNPCRLVRQVKKIPWLEPVILQTAYDEAFADRSPPTPCQWDHDSQLLPRRENGLGGDKWRLRLDVSYGDRIRFQHRMLCAAQPRVKPRQGRHMLVHRGCAYVDVRSVQEGGSAARIFVESLRCPRKSKSQEIQKNGP